jgi:hypothetical protein
VILSKSHLVFLWRAFCFLFSALVGWFKEVLAGWGFLVMQTQKKTIGELLISQHVGRGLPNFGWECPIWLFLVHLSISSQPHIWSSYRIEWLRFMAGVYPVHKPIFFADVFF